MKMEDPPHKDYYLIKEEYPLDEVIKHVLVRYGLTIDDLQNILENDSSNIAISNYLNDYLTGFALASIIDVKNVGEAVVVSKEMAEGFRDVLEMAVENAYSKSQ